MQPAVSGELIQKWSFGEREVCLSTDPTKENWLVVTDSRDSKKTTFEVQRFPMEVVSDLVKIFKQVIAKKLESQPIHSSLFLPIFCERGYQWLEGRLEPIEGYKVALFGDFDLSTERIYGVSWAIFNEANQAVIFDQPAHPSRLLEEFIQYAPQFNRPHPKSNYELDAYLKNFKLILDVDRTFTFRSVELRRCSLLDNDVLLDQDLWAVTLVSNKHISPRTKSLRDKIANLFDRNIGHAMLACEGVQDDGKPFFKYIHLTSKPKEPLVDLRENEGQVEEITDRVYDTVNGPTWPRPRLFIENMLQNVQSMKNRPIKFALYGSLSQKISNQAFRKFILTTASNKGEFYKGYLEYLKNHHLQIYPNTCLEGAVQLLRSCGIFFLPFGALSAPLEMVKQLHQVSIFKIPEGFDSSLLGRPLPVELDAFKKDFLAANVLILPMDCPVDDISTWAAQWIMEHAYAKDSRIEGELAQQYRILTNIAGTIQLAGEIFVDMQS